MVEVRRQPGQLFAEVVAEPAAELDRDREVLLVWTGEDIKQSAETTVLTEAEQ